MANHVKLGDSVHFSIATHEPVSGVIMNADEVPRFDVYEEATDTPILGNQSMALRSGTVGVYRGTYDATAANGFEAGKWYDVIASGLVLGVQARLIIQNYYVEDIVYRAELEYKENRPLARDEYVVQWYRDGTKASPTDCFLSVSALSDSGSLIASTAMTDFSSMGVYWHADYVNQMVPHEAYVVRTSGIIDGANRTWEHIYTKK